MAADPVLVWFERDLRLADHPALTAALEQGPILPVYIHDPDAHGEWAPGGASRWWLHYSLDALSRSLGRHNLKLHIYQGSAEKLLPQLLQQSGIRSVFCSQPLEPALVQRNERLHQQLESMGVDLVAAAPALLHEPHALRNKSDAPFRVFTPFWKACREQLRTAPPAPLPAPDRFQVAQVDVPEPCDLDALNLLPRITWDDGLKETWTPGEVGAQQRLQDFLGEAIGDYARLRDRPDRRATSALSAHLHFGEITPSQIWAAVDAADTGSDKFLAEVGWREFAHHLLHHFPETVEQPMDVRFKAFPWRDPDQDAQAAAGLRAWQRGETGVELVDAGMKELWHTGIMHNRVRMVVASFLTKNLLIHWQHGARWFWDTLVDADLASNTLGWQWTAGCGADAAPFFRVFNPDLQAQKFDPNGEYRRRWLGDGPHPKPIVDLKATRARALEAFQAIKRD